ncbi:MAG TPA: site-specific integrase, partial [Dehalococcoidia bacterium]|nr:site-specific integrase [Dehalococcoidia bacterium]
MPRYVFSQPSWEPVDPDKVSLEFARIVRETGLPHLTLHGFRHAHVTRALTAGINPKTVAELLVHASVVITLDTYSHVL